MLGELLTRLLGRAGVDEVVNLLEAVPEDLDFDAVVTTIALPDTLHAGIVLELPGNDEAAAPATMHIGGRAEPVALDGVTAILRLLDERLPGAHPRAS
jgi:hypothetical protein